MIVGKITLCWAMFFLLLVFISLVSMMYNKTVLRIPVHFIGLQGKVFMVTTKVLFYSKGFDIGLPSIAALRLIVRVVPNQCSIAFHSAVRQHLVVNLVNKGGLKCTLPACPEGCAIIPFSCICFY